MSVPIISSTIEHESWTADEMKIIERADSLCRDRNMQFVLICEPCFYAGRNPKVTGDNKRSSNSFALTCACKRRVYQPPVA